MIGDEGIAQLADLKFLKAIDLRLCSLVTDKAMETLSTMPELRQCDQRHQRDRRRRGLAPQAAAAWELDLRNCRGVTKTTIEKLAEKKTLRMLKIGGEKIDDAC